MHYNVRKIIREVIEDYVSNDGIKAVLFDFDMTLIDTSSFRGIDKEYLRATNDVSIAKELIPQTKMYSGIKNLLNYLSANGLKIGIVSNRNEALVNETLKFHGITADVIIGERLNCPKGIRISEALGILGINPRNAIYVGDSPWDNAESRKANVTFIGATWGNKRLAMGYNSPQEIIQYIDYINS